MAPLVVDADRIAREVVDRAPRDWRGSKSFRPVRDSADGSLDRPALGRIVFADAGARRDLEGITHPLIGAAPQLFTRRGPTPS